MEPARPGENRYIFLDYLRAAAAWLVAWDHLAVVIPESLGRTFHPARAVRNILTEPLGIIQDFGWFGVALFFLISGFIISDRARVEGVGEFVVKRVLRIYPMLAVAVALSAAFIAPKADVTVQNVLLNLTLANYLMIPQVVLVGVAWTLVIEITFYALTAVTQFAKASPHRIALNLVVVGLVIWKARAFGGQFFLFAAGVAFLPVLVMGQTIYWWLARRQLSTLFGFGYLLSAYGVFQWGLRTIHTGFLPVANSYLISVAYALLLFVSLVRVALPERRLIRFLSDTSYSIYLLHGIVGWAVLVLLAHAPLIVAIAAAAAASLLAAAFAHRLVELPVQSLARSLTRGWSRR